MSLKVLVVEDDMFIREMAVETLAEAGFQVLEASDGEEALGHCRNEDLDALVTDIQLPGKVDGWEVAERCRASDPDLPVIYATAVHASGRRPVRGSVWVQKPYSPDLLVGVVRNVTRGATGTGSA
jgi:DNA-binding response OmpR family regulator